MQLPAELLTSLEGLKGFERTSFIEAHNKAEAITSIRINPFKSSITEIDWLQKDKDYRKDFEIEGKVPWSQFGYYLKSRPSFTFDPLFHAGCYYVQDASSMFLEEAFRQLVNLSEPIKVLD